MAEIDPKIRRANILLGLLLAGVALGVMLVFIWFVGSQG